MVGRNRISFLCSVVIAVVFTFVASYAKAAPPATVEYLGNPGPINFVGTSFHLSWSSHPAPLFYKQEYIPVGQQSDTYTAMLMMDFNLEPQVSIDGLVKQKIAFLDQWKTSTSDMIMHHDLIQDTKTGDVILDFVMSKDLDKPSAIIEWNAYRYHTVTLADGRKGVLLYAISRRAYGDDGLNFMKALKTVRKTNIDALATTTMPHIALRHP